MQQTNVEQLEERALDYAVAIADGCKPFLFDDFFLGNGRKKGHSECRILELLRYQPSKGLWCYMDENGRAQPLADCHDESSSTAMLMIGRIVASIPLRLECDPVSGEYLAAAENRRPYRGATAISAIARCYVALKLGDLVDIPENLLPARTVKPKP